MIKHSMCVCARPREVFSEDQFVIWTNMAYPNGNNDLQRDVRLVGTRNEMKELELMTIISNLGPS